jgi:hypothetical protein
VHQKRSWITTCFDFTSLFPQTLYSVRSHHKYKCRYNS